WFVLFLSAGELLRFPRRKPHGIEVDRRHLRSRPTLTADVLQQAGQWGIGKENRSKRSGGARRTRILATDRARSHTPGGNLRHHADAELGNVVGFGLLVAPVYVDRAAERAADAIEPRAVLRAMGKHFGADCRRDRRSEDG